MDEATRVDMMISDTGRPQTQFLNAGQKNHTTAWTLMREALLSHSRKSATSLFPCIGREVGNLQRIPRTMTAAWRMNSSN
ncbi:hypothetical protein ACFQ7A_08525 [Streptomyces sp. NPDC056528]|uniref:hypothetical protein n=1 Tax=Streptomyces sp. NPDC056528 TaxID=3345854 RepID=UPI00369214CC